MGFTQQGNTRAYRFQGVVPSERPAKITRNIEFILNADMSLLSRCQIRLQDCPALCLQILSTRLASLAGASVPFASFAITNEDLSVFLAGRKAVEDAKSARRKHRPAFKPSASSQLKWPQVK